MPKLDLDAYVKEMAADPFEVEWAGKTYAVEEPPWVNLQLFARKMEGGAGEEFTDEDIKGFLSIFFGSEQFAQMAEDGLTESHTAMFKLFLEAGKFAMSRVPEEAQDPKAVQAVLDRAKPAKGSRSRSKGARRTSASSKQPSNGTSG